MSKFINEMYELFAVIDVFTCNVCDKPDFATPSPDISITISVFIYANDYRWSCVIKIDVHFLLYVGHKLNSPLHSIFSPVEYFCFPFGSSHELRTTWQDSDI